MPHIGRGREVLFFNSCFAFTLHEILNKISITAYRIPPDLFKETIGMSIVGILF